MDKVYIHRLDRYGGLAPLGPNTDQTADGTCDTDEAIVEVKDTNSSQRRSQITNIREELYPSSRALPSKKLSACHPFPHSGNK